MPRPRKQLDIADRDLWYLVGLVATDGCLSSNGRAVNITAKDFDFLDSIRRSLKLSNKIGAKHNGSGQKSWHIQISNKSLYNFLMDVGLTPKKSLTLGPLNIPEQGFVDFLRGVIDGDGGIQRWMHASNGCDQWSLRVHSAAPLFASWIKNAIETWFSVKGRSHCGKTKVFSVKFGKLAAQRILDECYYDGCLALARKFVLAKSCTGSVASWSKSKTVALAA